MNYSIRNLLSLGVLACLVMMAACDPGDKNLNDPSGDDDDAAGDDDDAAGDDDDAAGDDDDDVELAGRSFISEEVRRNGELVSLVPGSSLSISFAESGAGVWASAGCNTLSGDYSLTAGQLLVPDAGATEIGCDPPELATQEQWYFEFVMASPAYGLIENHWLELAAGDLHVRYRDASVNDEPLIGTRWEVDTIIEGDTASNAGWPNPAWLEFLDDGTVEFFAGCNDGGGSYELADQTIFFGEVGMTDIGCDELSEQLEHDVERMFAPDRPVAWAIKANRLTLSVGEYGLGLVAR